MALTKQLICFFILYMITNITILSADKINTRVTKIIDGDTIEIIYRSKPLRVRLLAIQAPELFTEPPQAFSRKAKNFLSKHILNKTVTIQYNTKHMYDKYKRLLGNIWLGSLYINAEIVKNGLAYIYILNDINLSQQNFNILIQSQKFAIKNNLNIWLYPEYQIIESCNANHYINQYKIIKARVKKIKKINNNYWIYLENTNQYGLSIFIANKYINNFNSINLNNLLNKTIVIGGYINKYSKNFGPLIKITTPYNILDIQK